MSEARSLVVGVGASAGGLEAFKHLLRVVPPDAGHSFLLVQHLSPDHDSLLVDLLQPMTSMAVETAEHRAEVLPNRVYVIPPDKKMTVDGGRLQLEELERDRGPRLSVDALFRSLAVEYEANSVGLILSGAGHDGTGGIREIKAAGGLTIAQEPDESGQRGMPQSAIDGGVIDLVLPLDEVPRALERFARLPTPALQREPAIEEDGEEAPLGEEELQKLRSLLSTRIDVDLRAYRPASVSRRVLRRMGLAGIPEVEGYIELLRRDEEETRALVKDLFIGVTDFFRDPAVFDELQASVIPEIVDGKAGGEALRIWVPGCATGEEAYSLGIEALEAIERRSGARASLQIFATDVDQAALDHARRGVFGSEIAERMSGARLAEWFEPLSGRGYKVRGRLRDAVSFAVHDLTSDPPFSRMDVVSCRNVMIYLTSEAQNHVRKSLHFALSPRGFLLLGTSETPGSQMDLFSVHSKKAHIYRRAGSAAPRLAGPSRPGVWREGQSGSPAGLLATGSKRDNSAREAMQQVILQACIPAAVVVNSDGTLLFAHGDTDPYLRFPLDDISRWDISSVIRPELATRSRAALYKCRSSGEPVTVETNHERPGLITQVTARPAQKLGEGVVVLSFDQRSRPSGGASSTATGTENDGVAAQLERELKTTKEDLRTTVEELESSNEELRSSNEEAMSMNEELQSTNEELEAMTEELRSLNEELSTVNTQLREKIGELEAANDDIQNFFASTKVATIFLDVEGRLQRFTPAASSMLNLDHADLGRRVDNLNHPLLQNGLRKRIDEVLEELTSAEDEIHGHATQLIARKTLPYRTDKRQIKGVVVTFDDVTELREANRELEEKSERLELAWETAKGGVFEYSIDKAEQPYVGSQWGRLLGLGPPELPESKFVQWLEARIHRDDLEEHRRSYEAFVSGDGETLLEEIRLRHATGRWIWMKSAFRALERGDDGRVQRVLGMMLDVTKRKRMEDSLRESERRFRAMSDGLPLIVWVHDEHGNQEFVNETFCQFLGVSREEMKGGKWQLLLHPEDAQRYTNEFQTAVSERESFHAEVRVRDAAGRWRWLESWGQPRFDDQGDFRGMVGTSVDVSERRTMGQAIRDSEELLRIAKAAAQLGVFDYDAQSRYVRLDARICELWGVEAADAEMTLSRLLDGVHSDDRRRVAEAFSDALERTSLPDMQFRVVDARDFSVRWIEASGLTYFKNQQSTRMVGTVREVTAERELQDRLIEADRQKNEFLAMLGHELRNPLSGIRTATEILKMQDTERSSQSVYAVLDRQTAHMSKLLDGLLDVSRIVLGKLSLDRQPQDLVEICRAVAWDAESRVREKGQDLELRVPDARVTILGDRVRLVQVIDNLVSNAIKYTPKGGRIRLELGVEQGEAVVRVVDDGLGMDSELLPYIFDEFRQANQDLGRADGGLGLGLALVRRLVELHQGQVEAHSGGPGRGSTFTVRLPLLKDPDQKEQESMVSKARAKDGLRILIIEDQPDAADMLKELLTMLGHEARVENDGRAGIEAAQADKPDLVLCDVGLPDGPSGFEVARALKWAPGVEKMVVVAVTGYGRYEDVKDTKAAGFDAHLTKPLDLNQLQDVMNEFFG